MALFILGATSPLVWPYDVLKGGNSGIPPIGEVNLKAFRNIGLRKSIKFLLGKFCCALLDHCIVPQVRVVLLRLFGAEIGRNTIIHEVKFINLYRGSFRNFQVGNDCFIGHDCLFDLAAPIRLGDQVTLAQRVSVLTHLNVGYPDHPLQQYYPARVAGVEVGNGAFVGVSSTIMCGVSIGKRSFIAAGSVVIHSTPDQVVLGGATAQVIRELPRDNSYNHDDSE